MKHLSDNEIQDLLEQSAESATAPTHLDECPDCAARLARAERMETWLNGMRRAQPAHDLSARILAQLPTHAAPPIWLALGTLLAAAFSLLFVFQTAFDMRANGAFDLIATFSAQPQIITDYPGAAMDAFTSTLPWAALAGSLLALSLVMVLLYRLAGSRVVLSRWR